MVNPVSRLGPREAGKKTLGQNITIPRGTFYTGPANRGLGNKTFGLVLGAFQKVPGVPGHTKTFRRGSFSHLTFGSQRPVAAPLIEPFRRILNGRPGFATQIPRPLLDPGRDPKYGSFANSWFPGAVLPGKLVGPFHRLTRLVTQVSPLAIRANL